MKTLQLQQMENVIGGNPMFGRRTNCIDGPADENGVVSRCEVHTYSYFFWFEIESDSGQDGPKYGSCASNGY